MTLLFLSLAVVIAIIVISVSAKHIKTGMEARSEINDDTKKINLRNIEENTLEKLKEKNLSQEDLKKIYNEIQKKNDLQNK